MQFVERIWGWIDSYASQGLEDLPENVASRRYAFGIVCLMGGMAALGYTLVYASYDFYGLWPAWSAAIACMPVLLLPRLARYSVVLSLSIGMFVVIFVFSYLTYHLGTDSGLHLFILVGILALGLVLGTTHPGFAAAMIVISILAMVASVVFFEEPSGYARVDASFQKAILLSVVVLLAFMVASGVYVLSVRVARAEEALAVEHARSEALLQNLLPSEIAARLKAKPGEVIADGLPAVTLLFADIVGFTPRAAERSPDEVVDFLNRIFSRFDELSSEFGLEKIKTIGDAYMVAAGLPVPRDDHASVVAKMAVAMQEAVKNLSDELGEDILLRIGIHSGPAVAGVIGTSKVFYDVWGDTVNTASRMESNGAAGRIQVTSATRALLGDEFEFESRGLVQIKGIGEIETYWMSPK